MANSDRIERLMREALGDRETPPPDPIGALRFFVGLVLALVAVAAAAGSFD